MTAAALELAQQLSTAGGRAAIAGRLMDNLAHRIRNSLAAISNSVYCLEAVCHAQDDQAREHLRRITCQVAAIEQLLRHITEFTERPTSGRQRFAMQTVVSDAVAAARLPRRDLFYTTLPQTPVHVVADPDQIRRAIALLIEFACRLLRESGRLELALRTTEQGVEVSLYLSETKLTAAQAKGLLKVGPEKPEGIDDPWLALALVYVAANGASLEVVPGEKGEVTLCFRLPR